MLENLNDEQIQAIYKEHQRECCKERIREIRERTEGRK